MNCIGTPNNLDVLLHYYTSPGPHDRYDAPAVQEAIKNLSKAGMLDRADFPCITEKGQAYIKHIMSVPFPVAQWVIPETAT